MTQVCIPVPLGCDVCYEIERTQDDTLMNVVAGLTPAATLYLWITDKFGNQYMDTIIVNGDGSFDIVIANYPKGMFNPSAGSFTIFISSDIDGAIIIPMTFSMLKYNCLIFSIVCCQGIGCMEIENDFIIS